MIELASTKKHKVNLSDYPYEQDISLRMFLSDCSIFDIQILEEILFSPLRTAIQQFSLKFPEASVLVSLNKFAEVGLCRIQDDEILIDKEMRKYFDIQSKRFQKDFKPDMEFAQDLLKKVPIHCLPAWYAVPRTSNHIFQSIVDKQLLTPQLFQRSLTELGSLHPLIQNILDDLFTHPELKLSSTDIISKYNLTRWDFEKMLLLLEFHFACCIVYEQEDDHWTEFVVPFCEWKEYLQHLQTTHPPMLPLFFADPLEFSFLRKFSGLLENISQDQNISSSYQKDPKTPWILRKLSALYFIEKTPRGWVSTKHGEHFLTLSFEHRAALLYRHPVTPFFSEIPHTEKILREAEKSIKRVLHGNWVDFECFEKGILVPLEDTAAIRLTKTGRQWKYQLPQYTPQEKTLFKAVVFEWLYQLGATEILTIEKKQLFRVTSFGRRLFED